MTNSIPSSPGTSTIFSNPSRSVQNGIVGSILSQNRTGVIFMAQSYDGRPAPVLEKTDVAFTALPCTHPAKQRNNDATRVWLSVCSPTGHDEKNSCRTHFKRRPCHDDLCGRGGGARGTSTSGSRASRSRTGTGLCLGPRISTLGQRPLRLDCRQMGSSATRRCALGTPPLGEA